MPNPANQSLTAIAGIKVGHWTDSLAKTGCTVILCPKEGCVASAFALGASPGSREQALLEPEKTVQKIHALVLTGGSAFGLAAATGVMDWLERAGHGVATPSGVVPIVPAAVIYDLLTGDATIRPDAKAGFEACQSASGNPVSSGSVGAGSGALVGKYLGFEHASAGGLGSAALKLGQTTVAALAVSNAIGDIVDLRGKLVAGSKAPNREKAFENLASIFVPAITNTTLVAVATDAQISKAEAKALAQAAHIGIAKVTQPSHTSGDGDTCFVLSTCEKPALPMMALSIAVQQVVAQAIIQGVKAANGLL